jgi:hypothetical protein
MADPTKDPYGGAPLSAFGDLSKVNLYGTEDEQLQELKNSQKDILSSLENRYSQPNWSKVSAGFLKPQLGGFAASLGSAFNEIGENVEQQRAAALPMAQIRSQMAQTNIMLNKSKDVSDEIYAWLHDPKNAGKLPPDQLIADWRGRAPESSAVKSLDSQIALQQKAREQANKNIDSAQKLGKVPSQADLDLLGLTQPPPKPTPQRSPEEIASLPIDPTKVKPDQKVNFGFAQIDPTQVMTPQGQTKIAEDEKEATARLNAIKEFGSQENFHNNIQNIDQLLHYAQKGKREKALLESVVNKMASDSSLLTAIGETANEGLHLNWNGYQASAGLPVKKFLNNLQDKEERRVAQMLVMGLDNANYIQTQLRGGLKGGLPVSEANVLTAGLFSRDLDYKVLMNGLLQLDNTLRMYNNIDHGQRYLRTRYGDQLTNYAPNYQIYNSDWYNNVINKHTNRAKEISEKYNASLSAP